MGFEPTTPTLARPLSIEEALFCGKSSKLVENISKTVTYFAPILRLRFPIASAASRM